MQHGQDNVQEPKTDEGEKAVARVKVYAFHMQPEQTFYLYKGINFVGRDPNECTVWLTDDFICRVHMIINVQDMFIFIQDAPKRPGEKPTTFYVNQIMELNTWYPCNPDMKFKLAGLLTLFDVTRLTTEEQEAAPRKGYITPEQQMAIDNKTYMEETFVGEGPTEHNTQPSAPPILMPSYYNQNHNTRGSSYNSRSASAPGYEREGDHIRAPSDHSFDSTQRIEDLTQVVREERHRSSRRISLPPIQPLEGVSADITLPRPIRGGPGCFNRPSKVPDHMLANHREYFDEIDASSQPKDIHHEATLVISDDLDDASQSSVILPETQPTQFLATTSEDLAPNSLPEDIIVSGGRPSVESQREDAVDVKDRAHGSRSGSVVPESPVPSQQDYIPSTPAELIGLSRTAVRDAQEQDPGEDEEDEDRVPQTPVEEQQDQKQHTAMSDVSTLEANQLSESIPDSQATQEAIQLSLSSDDQPQHCKQEDILVKTEEVESERHLLHSVDSQNVSLSSPGAVKAEDDDDEATKVDEDSKPRWRFGKEVCPDSQRSTQSSSRDRSREEVHVTSTSTTIITATNITLTSTGTTAYPQQPESPEPQASEQEMLNTDPYHSSQDSDRTASREGSPKHNLEPDAALEEPTKGKQIKVEDTDDVSTAAKGRSRRGASAARPNNSESADPHPSFVRTRSERRTRSSTMEVEHQHSIVISSPGWDEWKKKDALYKKPVGVYNDEAHTDMTVLVFNAIDGKRTCKLMCAIARGVPIVTDDWLKDSIADNHCRPTDDYLYEDKQMEEEYNFSFREVCAKGRINVENGIQIFNNYEFYCVLTKKYNGFNGAALTEQGYLVSETVRTNVIPMIKICGGKVLMRPAKPDSTKKERTIVIGQNVEDCSETQKYVAAGFKVMDKEFILSSILRQSPDLDFETYAIPAQPTTANAEEGDDAAEKSDATSASNTKSARSRSRSASVVPSMSRSSSSVRPQRSSSTLSTSSSSSAVASTSPKDTGTTGKKKRAPKKK